MPMEKKIVIVCEGKNDVSYLNALQRFVENDIPLPPGHIRRALSGRAAILPRFSFIFINFAKAPQ